MTTPTCPADEPEPEDPDSPAGHPEPEREETTPPGPSRKHGYQPL